MESPLLRAPTAVGLDSAVTGGDRARMASTPAGLRSGEPPLGEAALAAGRAAASVEARTMRVPESCDGRPTMVAAAARGRCWTTLPVTDGGGRRAFGAGLVRAEPARTPAGATRGETSASELVYMDECAPPTGTRGEISASAPEDSCTSASTCTGGMPGGRATPLTPVGLAIMMAPLGGALRGIFWNARRGATGCSDVPPGSVVSSDSGPGSASSGLPACTSGLAGACGDDAEDCGDDDDVEDESLEASVASRGELGGETTTTTVAGAAVAPRGESWAVRGESAEGLGMGFMILVAEGFGRVSSVLATGRVGALTSAATGLASTVATGAGVGTHS